MNHAVRIAPLVEAAVRRRHGAPRREPKRELVGGVEVERPAERPRLDEVAPLPQRRADVRLRQTVDARGELQLGRRLHLGVNPADVPDHVDELFRRRATRQAAPREPPRPNLIPGQRNRPRSTSSPPVSHESFPRRRIWT